MTTTDVMYERQITQTRKGRSHRTETLHVHARVWLDGDEMLAEILSARLVTDWGWYGGQGCPENDGDTAERELTPGEVLALVGFGSLSIDLAELAEADRARAVELVEVDLSCPGTAGLRSVA